MNVIRTYLDNMFAGLPTTKEVIKMKEDLLLNMEEKYLELKEQGKSENEAVGIVISEFGNIEELAEELGVDIKPATDRKTVVTEEIARDYMDASKKYGKLIALGVFLIILSPALLLLLLPKDEEFLETLGTGGIIGLVVLLIMVAISVALFIYAGMHLEEYNYLKSNIYVPERVKEIIKGEKKNFDPKFIVGLIVSVMMFIISPVGVIVISFLEESGNNDYNILYGVALLLLFVATGVGLIVTLGMRKDSHSVLLKLDNYANSNDKSQKIINTVAGGYWPIITAVYLLWSFLSNDWHITWLVWVIAGILFGAFSAVIQGVVKDDK